MDTLETIAARHGVSVEAARQIADSLTRSGGRQAQFDHPELGGMGQWMRGGMTQIGDMFDAPLKLRVSALCDALAALPIETSADAQRWWPEAYGAHAAAGGQNGLRYAFFPGRKQLLVREGQAIRALSTDGLDVTGFSQQQESLLVHTRTGSVPASQLPEESLSHGNI